MARIRRQIGDDVLVEFEDVGERLNDQLFKIGLDIFAEVCAAGKCIKEFFGTRLPNTKKACSV